MCAAYGPWFSDTATLAVEHNSTDIPIGKLQSLEVRVEVEETEYYSGDTTLREAVRHTEKTPVVVFEVGSWDIELHKQWLGGDGTSSTGLVDDSSPQKFDVKTTIAPVDDNTQSWNVDITGVTIPTLPFFTATRNEFVGNEFEGRGDDIDISQDPNPA